MTDFNLSEKILKDGIYELIRKEDVEEFIKRLKINIIHDLNGAEAYCNGIQKDMVKIIDKLAGSKLSGEKQ